MESRRSILVCLTVVLLSLEGPARGESGSRHSQDLPSSDTILPFFQKHCFDCHDSAMEEGGLNLEKVTFQENDRKSFERWVLIHDRVRDGEMPPKKKARPGEMEMKSFLESISGALVEADEARIRENGRAKVRRLNRFEYENSLREALDAPWLQVADMLPEDGTIHLFNKSSEQLDVSHVQMMNYLEAADYALRMAVQAAAHEPATNRFYAREEPVMLNYLRYRFGQTAATRAAIPLIGTTPEPDVIRGLKPTTVGESDPELREQEAMGFVSGTYSATTKYDFTRMDIPVDGRYRLRMKTYTFMAGPNGASGGDDHGLTGGNKAWWRPSRTEAFRGTRSEPVTLYALADGGDSRWLTTFDSFPDPQVVEVEVFLKQGEKIRPDASRLVRTRPGWKGNPNATSNGVPGLAFQWLEVEGPIHEEWPPASYRAVFGDLPFQVANDGIVKVGSSNPEADARRLLQSFASRVYRTGELPEERVEPFVAIYKKARELGDDFTEAMFAAFSSVLCSTEFLYLDARPGPLEQSALASRLSFFLWNGPPDQELLQSKNLMNDEVLREQAERLLNDRRSDRFINAFLDYWLDLRELQANAPDAELYPDYYLDDLLTESSVLETRRFFRELIEKDLPSGNLIASDFAFVNESLALHYGLPAEEGVHLKRVELPEDSPRGGLMTQASVLRVTANGTTTTPVIRGAWVMERLLGLHIPPPPSGVSAIEPDIRGAKTIREQLEKHTSMASCKACHAKFDPPGFALESFDIAGGWRERYRAIGSEGDPVEGIGKNGHAFKFRLAQMVESHGKLMDGREFKNIHELKQHLAKDERAIARNLVQQLIVYATGAPVSFADRGEVESILDECAENGFGVRSLIHGVVQSELFRVK